MIITFCQWQRRNEVSGAVDDRNHSHHNRSLHHATNFILLILASNTASKSASAFVPVQNTSIAGLSAFSSRAHQSSHDPSSTVNFYATNMVLSSVAKKSGVYSRTYPGPSFGRGQIFRQSAKEEAVSLENDQPTTSPSYSTSFISPISSPIHTSPTSSSFSDPTLRQGNKFTLESRTAIILLRNALLLLLSLWLLLSVAAPAHLHNLTHLPSSIFATYSNLLIRYPLPTKSLTSGTLCGLSDILAQVRDKSRKQFNFGRWIRFAGKGCIGGIIWSFWYDALDGFLSLENSGFNIYTSLGIIDVQPDSAAIMNRGTSDTDITRQLVEESPTYRWIQSHDSFLTTILSILIEQFFWCPIVFGIFEIPVSTLLNGGANLSTVSKIGDEVKSKLSGLLVSNAKIWTVANIVIYNAPIEWRLVISNCVDVIWQSIVSDVAADCGKVQDDVCIVTSDRSGDNVAMNVVTDIDVSAAAPGSDERITMEEMNQALGTAPVDEDTENQNRDYSFYAEKSRI